MRLTRRGQIACAGPGRLWRSSGPDELAYSEPGKEPQVQIQETPFTGRPDRLEVPPISVSLYALAVR